MVPRPGNAGWAGTSDGVAARGFVNGARRAAVGGKAPQVRTGPKSLPAGRLGRGNTVSARRQTRTRKHGPCPQADSAAGTPPGREPEFFDLEITC